MWDKVRNRRNNYILRFFSLLFVGKIDWLCQPTADISFDCSVTLKWKWTGISNCFVSLLVCIIVTRSQWTAMITASMLWRIVGWRKEGRMSMRVRSVCDPVTSIGWFTYLHLTSYLLWFFLFPLQRIVVVSSFPVWRNPLPYV